MKNPTIAFCLGLVLGAVIWYGVPTVMPSPKPSVGRSIIIEQAAVDTVYYSSSTVRLYSPLPKGLLKNATIQEMQSDGVVWYDVWLYDRQTNRLLLYHIGTEANGAVFSVKQKEK